MRGLRIPWDDLGYVVLGRLTPPRSMCTGGMHASSAVLELVLAKTTACTCGRARKLHSTPRTCSVPRTKFTRTPVVLCPLREGLSPSEGFLPHAARSTQMGGHSSHTIPGRIIRASARPPSTTFVSAAGRTLAPTPIDRAQLRACFLTPPLSTLHRAQNRYLDSLSARRDRGPHTHASKILSHVPVRERGPCPRRRRCWTPSERNIRYNTCPSTIDIHHNPYTTNTR